MIVEANGKKTALHLACEGGHEKVVARLLDVCPSLIDVECGAHRYWTALQFAAAGGHDRVVAQLLAMNPKVASPREMNALHLAAAVGHDKVLALLLAARLNLVLNTSREGNTALALRSRKWNTRKVFSQLVTACPDLIDRTNAQGKNVLHCAAEHGHDNLIEQILALRPDMINQGDRHDWHALRWAIRGGKQNTVEKLLTIKPELIYEVSKYGETLLHDAVASDKCDKELVRRLWQKYPQALHQDNNRRETTPFLLAFLSRRPDLIEMFQWSVSFDEAMRTFAIERPPSM